MLEIALSVLAVSGTYEFIYDILPTIPIWLTLPLLIGLSVGAYFLPLAALMVTAVAATAGLIHGVIRWKMKASVVQVAQSRRSGLPPLP